LQATYSDVISAYSQITNIINTLQQKRANPEVTFCEVFLKAQAMAQIAGIELTKPRLCTRQRNRANISHENQTVENYWRLNLFLPFLDHTIQQLNTRFGTLSQQAHTALKLIPEHLEQVSRDDANILEKVFGQGLPQPGLVIQEVDLWKSHWSTCDIKPSSLRDTLRLTPRATFPNIYYMLYCCLLWSSSSASTERAHSALGLVKSKLRSTMLQPRLISLLLLFVHKDLNVEIEQVISIFARMKPRRMRIAYPLADID